MNAMDSDMVFKTVKGMRDMQQDVIKIVAGVLFGNVLIILLVCLCQEKHRVCKEGNSQPEPVAPGLAVANFLLGMGYRGCDDPRILEGSSWIEQNAPEANLLADVAAATPRSESDAVSFNACQQKAAVSSSSPGGGVSGTSSRASCSSPTKGSQQRADGHKLDDMVTPAAGSHQRSHSANPSKRALEPRAPLRTVDAFCTPRSSTL
jgi:hypothetical protein